MTLLLDMKGINKSFNGVQVLKNIELTLHSGEVLALLGENGAGKSTLMKILGGVYPKDSGQIMISQEEQEIRSPRDASRLGIAMIHQELNLIPNLTVMENIFLGREFTYNKWKWLNWKMMRKETERLLSRLGVRIDPAAKIENLSVGQQQMIEIAKALSIRAKILVLDEPTAALTDRETKTLFQVIQSLKQEGVGMIYISHRLEEIFQICDRITVLRDGSTVATRETNRTDMEELIRLMVGRELEERFPEKKADFGSERLRVEGVSRKGKVRDISFAIHSGEIVGIAGLMGSGRTEVARLLFGADRMDRGKIYIDGEKVRLKHPGDAIQKGIAYVTEDRKKEGLVLSLSVRKNLSLPSLSNLSSFGWIQKKKEKHLTYSLINQLSIRSNVDDQEVRFLSGGNQQKVVIGKWLATSPKILIMDEPTRGVDIGAKQEIYQLMNRFAEQGLAVLLISSDMEEVLGMSDRILVMHEGRISGEFTREEANQEKVMAAASGGGKNHAV
ncbi:sugar ABC transporter ATP-binding protein [Paenactinomyces guangxiensis]|uniref:Sugar ABC transporter ATP-binding protein n=1 Tax=Paenactinomyces guangxiensis TaxID=1490290 RepID=A0A7W2A8D3_9BACL|nr:sugar ABC transporter ATP-binding protein [Paenactinomyces guangxiensis]MBA4495496.1 sugar ABC transporter ATP-binding protein [Paenactinomyces guangxiensis]MBH8592381.1 sugar ABC transporter ATP-binding protein [Paenactinomyces guangxiensis]